MNIILWLLAHHLFHKQSLTVAEEIWAGSTPVLKMKKTPYISPFYQDTKDNPLTQFVRDFLPEHWQVKNLSYFSFYPRSRWFWIVMATGLSLLGISLSDELNFLTLAVFGGLLFFFRFRGRKDEILIQFLYKFWYPPPKLAQYPQALGKFRFWTRKQE